MLIGVLLLLLASGALGSVFQQLSDIPNVAFDFIIVGGSSDC